jgi:CRISPR system Cascade subunit CasD
MMSFGDHSRFTIRDTRREPTKSAVIGLLCAALGRPRWEPIEDLAALKMGVRVNKEGIVQCDYHTVMNAIKSNGDKGDTVVSQRYYIADADYLVGLESSDRTLLEQLDIALLTPTWQLYFGRKSFVPSCSIRLKVSDQSLNESLCEHPYQGKSNSLRYVIEVPNSLDVRRDVPLDWQKRLFGSRCVETIFHTVEVRV